MTWTNTTSRSLSALVLIAFLATPAAANVDGTAAQAEVSAVMDQVMAVFQDGSLDKPARRAKIEEIAYERFDFATISKLVLARNWKKLSEEQRADFLVEFKRHLSFTYGRRLENAKEERIEVTEHRVAKKGDVTVMTVIKGGAADGATIDYRMRNRDGKWLVIDVTIEGISLVQNFRAQVQEIVSASGADSLIEQLRSKNEKAPKD